MTIFENDRQTIKQLNKKHGLTGNKNAKKDNPKLGVVQFRVDMDKKSKWKKYSQSHGLTLSQFLEIAADSFLEK